MKRIEKNRIELVVKDWVKLKAGVELSDDAKSQLVTDVMCYMSDIGNCGYFEKHILHFDIGDSVYLKIDPKQEERLVTGINIRQNGISYALSHLTGESYHYDFEISKERDIIKATSY